MNIETPDDYGDEMTVDGENITFGIDEIEVINYVAKCTYNGKEIETDPYDNEDEAESALKDAILYERNKMHNVELAKLSAWNAGRALKA